MPTALSGWTWLFLFVGLLGLPPAHAGPVTPLDARLLTSARLLPAGTAGVRLLLGPDAADLDRPVRAAVAQRGFYSGDPLGAGECGGCHAEVARQWAGSAHRFASFNNPYYAAAVDALQRERPPEQGRFCAGCHDPLLLIDDRIAAGAVDRARPEAQGGLTCLLCHSVQSVDVRGNGGYHVRLDPVPEADPTSTALGRVSAHTARLLPAVLKTPQLCAACHKVGLLPSVTGGQWLRGQNDYDPWEQSLAGGHGAAAVYREGVKARRCQECHMPIEPGTHVRSHRFLAANLALPALREDPEQGRRVAEFLRGAVSLDLAVGTPDGPSFAQEVAVAGPAAGRIQLDVVLRNRRVGHRFPGGTNDSNDVWIEVEARAAGGPVFRDDTHLVRAQAVDDQGEPLQRRDVQHVRGVVYDTSVAPADPQVVRYQLDLSSLPPGATVALEARLRYRKFTPAYAEFACAALPTTTAEGRAARERCLKPPVLDVATAGRTLRLSRPGQRHALPGSGSALSALGPMGGEPAGGAPLWQRYLDLGLGLSDGLVERSGDALPSLERARALQPDRVEPLLGLARMHLSQGRMDEVMALCAEVERRDPTHPAALWLRAQAQYRTYRWQQAQPFLEQAARRLPGDRNVLSMLARVRGLVGDPAGALAAADQLLSIDPEHEDGHYQRMLALRELGRAEESRAAEGRYLYHRRPVELDQALRARFRAQYPARADEDTPAHVHALLPVSAAASASPLH